MATKSACEIDGVLVNEMTVNPLIVRNRRLKAIISEVFKEIDKRTPTIN